MNDTGKRTMTLNLTAREMEALEVLASKKDLSKTATLRLALRLLQAVDAKVQMGQKLYVEDERTKDKSELILI
ncbi:MAG: transcriptional regulator [Armatimonadetes bacterium]|nr:transcriptional regulator [Akkermansiaceae bacterium]